MNPPEGWPTEEMAKAARNKFTNWIENSASDCATVLDVLESESTEQSCWISFWEGWKAALAAAPTPPVPVLQLETHLSDRDVKALHDYLVQVATPPAQEDEPSDSELENVLIPLIYKRLPPKAIEQLTYTAWKDGVDIECVGAPMKALIREVISVYTRPEDDNLRKAAEELFADQFLDGCVITAHLAQKLAKLRAALERKPTPSNTDKPFPG